MAYFVTNGRVLRQSLIKIQRKAKTSSMVHFSHITDVTICLFLAATQSVQIRSKFGEQ